MYGAVESIRPKMMTVSVTLAGIIPIMFSHGTGADVQKFQSFLTDASLVRKKTAPLNGRCFDRMNQIIK